MPSERLLSFSYTGFPKKAPSTSAVVIREMYQVKIEPMSENLDWPTGLWRLIVVNTEETDLTFITVLGENLPFQ